MTSRLDAVARQAGVSRATVSRVLNGKPGASEATRAAVLTAVDVLGYERPAQARGRCRRIGAIVVPELRNPIFAKAVEALGGALMRKGLSPVVCTTQEGGSPEPDTVDMLLGLNAAGVIFMSGLHAVRNQDLGHYQRILEQGLPLVVMNGSVDDLPFHTVSTDDEAAVTMGLEHLMGLGHQRIGLVISDDDHIPGHRKFLTFDKLVARQHAGSAAMVERSVYSLEGGFTAGRRLIDRGATAILCGSDVMALGVIRAAHRSGLAVPRDLSIVGFDDAPFASDAHPPLTTVRQAIDDMAGAAVGLLVSQINGTAHRPDELLFEPELVVRRSTGAPPTHTASRDEDRMLLG